MRKKKALHLQVNASKVEEGFNSIYRNTHLITFSLKVNLDPEIWFYKCQKQFLSNDYSVLLSSRGKKLNQQKRIFHNIKMRIVYLFI